MSRFRVAYQEVNGWNFYDMHSRSEAIRRAKLHRQAGARGVHVMEERDHPPGTDPYTARVTANFVTVWP